MSAVLLGLLGLLVVLVAVSYGTAVIPLGPPEAYVLALTLTPAAVALGPRHVVVWGIAVAVAGALGQAAGKLTVFLGVRRSLACRPRFLARLMPDRLLGRISERVGTHPRTVVVLVGLSALASVPPLTVVAPAAGTIGMRPRSFVAATFAGRVGRFAAIALVPALLR